MADIMQRRLDNNHHQFTHFLGRVLQSMVATVLHYITHCTQGGWRAAGSATLVSAHTYRRNRRALPADSPPHVPFTSQLDRVWGPPLSQQPPRSFPWGCRGEPRDCACCNTTSCQSEELCGGRWRKKKNHWELIKPSSVAPGAIAVQEKQINQPMVKNSPFDYCLQSSSKDSITT